MGKRFFTWLHYKDCPINTRVTKVFGLNHFRVQTRSRCVKRESPVWDMNRIKYLYRRFTNTHPTDA